MSGEHDELSVLRTAVRFGLEVCWDEEDVLVSFLFLVVDDISTSEETVVEKMGKCREDVEKYRSSYTVVPP